MDLTSALTLSDTVPEPGVSAAEPSAPLPESNDSSPIHASPLPVEPPTEPSVCIKDPLCTSSVGLLQASAESESMADASPAQVEEDETGPAEESAEPLDEAPAHHCSHESDEEQPEE